MIHKAIFISIGVAAIATQLLLPNIVFAESRQSQEAGAAPALASLIGLYVVANNGQAPASWDDFPAWHPAWAEGNSLLAVGQGVSESFAFIPAGQRQKFPLGELLLVQNETVMHTDALTDKYTEEELAALPNDIRIKLESEIAAAQEREKPVRFVIYRDANSRVVVRRWYDDDFQAMLQETGITIPRPTPYYPKGPDGEYLPLTPQAIEALVRLDLTDTLPPELLAKMQTAGTLPANFTAKGPRGNSTTPGANPPANAPTTLAQIITSPWAAWALAALALIAAVLYFRRHRAQRG